MSERILARTVHQVAIELPPTETEYHTENLGRVSLHTQSTPNSVCSHMNRDGFSNHYHRRKFLSGFAHNIFVLNSCVIFVKLPGVYAPSVLMANAIGTNTEIYARDKITGTICILDTPMRSPP